MATVMVIAGLKLHCKTNVTVSCFYTELGQFSIKTSLLVDNLYFSFLSLQVDSRYAKYVNTNSLMR